MLDPTFRDVLDVEAMANEPSLFPVDIARLGGWDYEMELLETLAYDPKVNRPHPESWLN